MTEHHHREGLAYASGACECGLFVWAMVGGYVANPTYLPGQIIVGRVKDGRLYRLDDPRGKA